jgi:SAM-dependent methyltransferase
MNDSFAINLANWEERVPAHAAAKSYAVDRFVEDPTYLSKVVRFDSARLGDIEGLDGVHLQCHIGTDTVSLARLGARMVGLDFSPAALAQARSFARKIGADVEFVRANVYAAVDALGAERFDFVYVSVGALCWLPDVRRWAQTVSKLLKPGGRLFMREGHPMLWALADPRDDGLLVVDYPYFERPEPTVWEFGGTYADPDAVFATTVTQEWNHGLGAIVSGLIEAGMRLTMLVEHDSAPYDPLPGMTEEADGEWRLADRAWRVPMTYTLGAVKPKR